MKILTPITLLILLTASTFGFITDADKRLNDTMRKHSPVYCNPKRADYTYYPAEFEFVVSMKDGYSFKDKPWTDMDHAFLGYENIGATLEVHCNTLHPTSKTPIESKMIATFPLKKGTHTFLHTIQAEKNTKDVEISLEVVKTKMNIRVKDSGKMGKFFKAYDPENAYNVTLAVKN